MAYNKYKNEPIIIDGIRFQSKMEGKYYSQLKVLKQAGIVKSFERQVPFKVSKKRKYFLDFKVHYSDGRIEYVDVKGKKTQMYLLKKDIVEENYGIKITEIKL